MQIKGDLMKIMVMIGLVVCLIDNPMLHADHAQDTFDTIPTVSWHDIAENMDFVQGKQRPRWYVVNVLPRDICIDCCIPGSINIPTHQLNSKNSKLKRWPRSAKIIIYCAGGDCPLSKYAYQALHALGFTDVAILDGGMRLWKKNLLPTVGRCKSGYLN